MLQVAESWSRACILGLLSK